MSAHTWLDVVSGGGSDMGGDVFGFDGGSVQTGVQLAGGCNDGGELTACFFFMDRSIADGLIPASAGAF